MWNRSKLVVIAVMAALLPPVGARAQGYTPVIIQGGGATNIYPQAINDKGQVAGTAAFSGATRAFLWTPATSTTGAVMKNLGTYKSYQWSNGTALNNRGDVVGRVQANSTSAPQATYWQGGGAASLIFPANARQQSEAYAINDSRQIVGEYTGQTAQTFLSQMVNGTRQTAILGYGWPGGITSAGKVLVRYNGTGYPAYVWTPSTSNGMTGAATAITEGPWVISDLDQIAGDTTYTIQNQWGTYNPDKPSLYVNGAWTDIPFPSIPPPSGAWVNGGAEAISSTGRVVGWMNAYDLTLPPPYSPTVQTVFVSDSSNGTRDINTLVPVGWVVTDVYGINKTGQILAKATSGGVSYAVLLNPSSN